MADIKERMQIDLEAGQRLPSSRLQSLSDEGWCCIGAKEVNIGHQGDTEMVDRIYFERIYDTGTRRVKT